MNKSKGSHSKQGQGQRHPGAPGGAHASHAGKRQGQKRRIALAAVAVLAVLAAAGVWAALALRGKAPAAASQSGQSGAAPGTESSGGAQPIPKPAANVTVPVDPAAPEKLALPYTIPGYGLQVEQLFSYDGIFVEDGSDTDAAGITAVLLKNTGATAVEYAEITVTCGGRDLLFKASAVPAGAEIVVMEANRAAYAEGDVTAVSAIVAERDTLEMSQTQIQVADNGDNSLTVSNISAQDIGAVRLFYKFYMEEGVYVGGIAYTAKLDGLKAGESVKVTPSHYASGYSRIVMVRVE